jgi:hypothetical protein
VAKTITPENIGAAIAQLANKVDAWKRQRDELIGEGERLAGVALGYVRDLRGGGKPASTPARKGGRPKGMKMSEETRAKLRAAWKRRKAAGGGAEQTKVNDERAHVRASTGRRRSARASKRTGG